MKKQCIFNWSGGKDSSLALYHCLRDPEIEIRYLVTTVNDEVNRISMHGVREELLLAQAKAIGIPLHQIRLPEMPDMDAYDRIMEGHLQRFKAEGITHSIFGDIFLEDLRNYREARLAEAGLEGLFPLWGKSTSELISEFLGLGFRTLISCTQADLKDFCGREITPELISQFPGHIDVCGENGEFHTFVFAGPIFHQSLRVKTGEQVFKSYKRPGSGNDGNMSAGFWFTDLLADRP